MPPPPSLGFLRSPAGIGSRHTHLWAASPEALSTLQLFSEAGFIQGGGLAPHPSLSPLSCSSEPQVCPRSLALKKGVCRSGFQRSWEGAPALHIFSSGLTTVLPSILPAAVRGPGPMWCPAGRLHSRHTEWLPLPLCPRLAFLLLRTSLCVWTPHPSLSLPLLFPSTPPSPVAGRAWLLQIWDRAGALGGWSSWKKVAGEGKLAKLHTGWDLNREGPALSSCTSHTPRAWGQPHQLASAKRLLPGMVWDGRFQNQVWVVSGALEEQRL